MKCMTRKYGGWGYAHILNVLVPRFRAVGIGSNELQTLMVKNPRRLLTFCIELRERPFGAANPRREYHVLVPR